MTWITRPAFNTTGLWSPLVAVLTPDSTAHLFDVHCTTKTYNFLMRPLMESVNTPRQVYLYLSDLDTVLKTLKDLNVSRGDIPETARLHNAPQQCDAMTLLSGNARNAANKS